MSIDTVWLICKLIVDVFKLTVIGLMFIGLYGCLNKGNFNSQIAQDIYNELFVIED